LIVDAEAGGSCLSWHAKYFTDARCSEISRCLNDDLLQRLYLEFYLCRSNCTSRYLGVEGDIPIFRVLCMFTKSSHWRYLTYFQSVLLLQHHSGIFWRIDYNSARLLCQLPYAEVLWVAITSAAYLPYARAPSSHNVREHFLLWRRVMSAWASG
jgi:hypothetical protein